MPSWWTTHTSSTHDPAEDRVVRVAGPVNAVARGGVSQRHGRRAVAGVAGVPEMIGSVVADQDVAALADLAVPGVAARCRRRPGSPGSASRRPTARRAGPAGRPAGASSGARQDRKTSGEAKASQRAVRPMNHRASSFRMRSAGHRLRSLVGSGGARWTVAIGPSCAVHHTLRSAHRDGTLKSVIQMGR